MTETCYWCEKPATSSEHVPPKCIFPVEKDIGDGQNRRENLITVPSCDEHNGEKSKDDEYLLCVLAIGILNNEIGTAQAITKVKRALSRSPGLAATVLKEPKKIIAETIKTGERQETVALKLDHDRMMNALEHIARALYFHHYERVWAGKVISFVEFQMAFGGEDDQEKNESYEKIRADADFFMADAPKHGENPDVFYYQVKENFENLGVMVMRLTFYEGAKVLIRLIPQGDTSGSDSIE